MVAPVFLPLRSAKARLTGYNLIPARVNPVAPRADHGRRKIEAALTENPGSKEVVSVSCGYNTPTGSVWFCTNR